MRQRGHSCGHVDYFMWEEFPSYRSSIHVKEHTQSLLTLLSYKRVLDLRTRTTTSRTFYFKVFWRIVEKYTIRKVSLYYFSPEKLVRLFLLEKV